MKIQLEHIVTLSAGPKNVFKNVLNSRHPTVKFDFRYSKYLDTKM